MSTLAEFYLSGTTQLLARVEGVGAIPARQEVVNIRKKDYVVSSIMWAVDHSAGTVYDRRLRANIWCTEVKP